MSLFILLLIGYSQLFAPLYRGSAAIPPARKIAKSTQGQALDLKTADTQTIFIAEEEEEEDDRISFRKQSECMTVLSFVYSTEYFFLLSKNFLAFSKDISRFLLSNSPYLVFQVFRL